MLFSLVKLFFLLPILPLQAQGFDLISLKLHKQQEENILILPPGTPTIPIQLAVSRNTTLSHRQAQAHHFLPQGVCFFNYLAWP